MKACYKCKIEKEEEEFAKNIRTKSGLQNWCRLCMKEANAKHYANGYNEVQKRHNNKNRAVYKQQIREFIIESRMKGCTVCGENRFPCLDFHHRDPSVKEIGISAAIRRGWSKDRLLNEIDKCDLLCANCHRMLHWEENHDHVPLV